MSPVTVTGTVTQILAEAMAGIALTQLIRPGCPVIFGTFAAAVSMATGAPTFGTPEPSMVIYAAAKVPKITGQPGRINCVRAMPAIASARIWVTVPVTVTGDMAPERIKGETTVA